MNDQTHPICPECNAPLEADGVCLACMLGEALEVDESSAEAVEADSRFGSYAPQNAGVFGKYTLRRRLGSGGMGVIWEAEETVLHRVVALKMIRGFVFSSDSEKLRFRTEATAVAQLDHPSIVPVYEVGEAEGQPFFTMKLLDGGSLSERLKDGALAAREAAQIMEKMARAVQHAHERGVLHRDLKPGNVLFDKAGEPFLTDFGLAKLVDSEQGLTLSHAQVGTPQYMSPEQARGRARDVTTASDVWALGAMLYQMLTGRLPFPGHTPAEIFSHIAHDEPVSLRTLAASADSDLETLCLRCLEKEPSRRLPSAGALADELARWLRGEPIRSRRVTGRERALRWARRYPWRVAAGAALLVSLLAGTIVSLALWRRSETSRLTTVESGEQATKLAAAERFTGYVSTMAATLAARERHDFARARQLLAAAPEEHRGLEWRLLDQLCAGDQRSLFRLPGGALPDALGTGPDGESLAIVTHDGVLHLCRADGSALRPPRRLPALSGKPDPARLNPREYHSLTYAPGGRYFACCFRNTVRVFDAETLEVVMERSAFLIQPQTAWLDERRLLFGTDRSTAFNPGTGAWIFDAQDRSTIDLPQAWSAPLAVSADRSVVALTGAAQREVSFLRATDFLGAAPLQNATPIGRWTHRSFGAPGWGNVLALSADGRYFATLCGPFDDPAHYLEVAETATGRTLLRGQGFREAMTGLVLHPTEPLVALVGTDAVVRMFHFLNPIAEGQPTYDDDCALSIREPLNGNGAHSPPRRLLTRSAQNGRAAFLLGHEGRGTGVVFARDGASLFTSAADGTVRCWNPYVPAPPARITDVYLTQIERHPSVSPDGSRLLYCIRPHAVRYWQEGRGYTHLADDHLPLAVLPAGRLATMERKTSDIILWQEEGDTIRETDRIHGPGYIQGFDSLLRGLVFPCGTKIAGITPGQVFVVDLEKKTATATSDQGWETGPSRAWDMAISPDGRHLAATGLGRRVRLYDPADLTKPAPPIGEFRTYDTALVFHPDGSRLYCGNEDGRVRVFDTTTWTALPEESWQAHSGAVTALAISNDNRLLATSGDTTLKLWLTEKAAGAARVEMLSFSTYFPAAWLHFGRDADGSDRSLLHVQPFCPLEIWPGTTPARAAGMVTSPAGTTNFAVGVRPRFVAVKDFNGDGKPDLVVANDASKTVSILLGNGAGGFGAATYFTVGSAPYGIAAADFNGDSKLDLAVANLRSDDVSILLGNGAGSFGAATHFPVGSGASWVAVKDLNGDGHLDLATANAHSNNVSILLGNGTGSFGAATHFAVGTAPRSVEVGDFNGDGRPDLAVANHDSNDASILLGDGTGSFGAATHFTVGTNPHALAVGDLNGDGKPDLALANWSSHNVSILLGTGTGTFGAATNFPAGTTPSSVSAGDFNGDGKPDLAVANFGSHNVSILLGNGAGNFVTATNPLVGTNPVWAAVADLNGDGQPDLAAANWSSQNVSILLNPFIRVVR